MKLLGQHYMLEALELATAAARPRRQAAMADDEDLSPRPSREAIAAAWRSWAERDQLSGAAEFTITPGGRVAGRRGLALSAPPSES